MVIRSATEVSAGDVLTTDICVIGSGAAGITLARCLDGTRSNVLLLEAGGLKRDIDVETETFQIDHVGAPAANPLDDRGRWLGGSTNLWYGRIARPDPIDFAQRDWVPKSGWPIELAELDQWIDIAANILEVPHFDKFDLDAWPTNETMRAFASDKINLSTFLWSDAHEMAKAARPLLDRSHNVTTMTDAAVQQIVVDDSSRINEVRVVCPSGGTFTVRASQFVLAAGGIENPRLLLASNERIETGLGNQHDNVGRYFLDHPRGEGNARIDLRGLSQRQLNALEYLDENEAGPFGTSQLRLVFPEDMQRSEELLNNSLHGYLVSEAQFGDGFDSYKRLRDKMSKREITDRDGLAKDLISVGKHLPRLAKLAAGKDSLRSFVVVDQMEQEPDPDSRVMVDHRTLDRFGLPRVVCDWRIGESTRRSQQRMHELFGDSVESLGITTFSSDVLDHPDEEAELIDMKHPSGTTRMSSSPVDGVVDTDCRVHGIDNLFIAGSSTFPTSGHFNPTLLIVALAARLARHLGELQGASGRQGLRSPEQSLPSSLR